MSSAGTPEPLSLHASADFLTMAVARTDDAAPPEPEGRTIEQVFAALESPLLGYAQQLLGDFGIAEEIVQEAFMRLHAQFAQIHAPRPWLYRTVHNLAIDHRRRVSRLVPLAPPDQEEESAGENLEAALPDEEIARGERIGLVRLVLETLDARSREVVRLRFHEELSYKEIGGRLGLGIGHVGYLLHHALKAVAVELEKTEVQS